MAKRRRLRQAFGIVEGSTRTLEPWYSQKTMVGSIMLSVVEGAAPAFYLRRYTRLRVRMGGLLTPSCTVPANHHLIVAIPASPCMRQNPTKNGMPQKYGSLPIVALQFMQRPLLEGLSLQKAAGSRIGINGMPFRLETKASSSGVGIPVLNISHSSA